MKTKGLVVDCKTGEIKEVEYEISDEELQRIQEERKREETEAKIQVEMQSILRQMAIESLKNKGELSMK